MHTINLDAIKLTKNIRLLDAGCGTGRHLTYAKKKGLTQLYGIDLDDSAFPDIINTLNETELSKPSKTMNTILKKSNLEALPFRDDFFDVVICSEVLEHVVDVEACLSELYRVLKPEGIAMISVPRFWPEKLCWFLSDAYHQNEGGHVRIFTKKKLLKKLKKTAFKPFKFHYAHAFHSPFWWLKCLFWNKKTNIIARYERFLIRQMYLYSLKTNPIESALNPLLGKSMVFYAKK